MSTSDPLARFTPTVSNWFREVFGAPTAVQEAAWPAIATGRDVLLAAPTGSGKTLAAFLWALDGLARVAAQGRLAPGCRVLYVSPLKALSNDIRRNLEEPLDAIQRRMGPLGDAIEAAVRTGDTPPRVRERMRRHPPHILVTTPESLYLLLTSEGGRRLLAPVETVIVDELHAVASSKRGAHLALSLERLAALVGHPLQRIGLSATQRPAERVAAFLAGAGRPAPRIVDLGHVRQRDLALEMPRSPLETVMSNEVWGEVYDRLTELARAERSTLVFVNTRRLAERAGRHLAERLGDQVVAVHHGSLSRAERQTAEQRLKDGELRALVATASLELGIDVGDVDLVCQLGSPRTIATFLQRVGRAGHSLRKVPKGRLFPLSRDDLTECVALLDAVSRDRLEEVGIPSGARDVLAQQIVAEVAAAGECRLPALLKQFQRAWPYRELQQAEFLAVVEMLARGISTRRGRRLAHLSFERGSGMLRARGAARRFALENGGVIPDQFDYEVRLLPDNLPLGTVNEDFAFESLAGDIFQLGNRSYRMVKVDQGTVYAEDARGAPPNIPFWFGEAPGRSAELCDAVSQLYQRAEQSFMAGGESAFAGELTAIPGVGKIAAASLSRYLAEAQQALGCLPRARRLILERFFDEVGDQHLVIHSPLGIRINRALGLALRKRFCRRFNFELQAAADDNALILSLGATHSFPLAEVPEYVRASDARPVLVQAVLQAPMFPLRWRWVAGTALALARRRNGRRVPAPFQRADAEDLVALVFPDQLACQDNIVGEREVPDHPLVAQTLDECLSELMDVAGLEALLAAREAGDIECVARDLPEPSPLARGIVNARPWAFLDDGAAEERRTRSVGPERSGVWAQAAGAADGETLDRLRAEAWPGMQSPEDLVDALVVLGFVTAEEGRRAGAERAFAELAEVGRAAVFQREGGEALWVAPERVTELLALFPEAHLHPTLTLPAGVPPDRIEALRSLFRSRLEGLGPVRAETLGAPLGLDGEGAAAILQTLEAEGSVMRGRHDPEVAAETWCDRHLAARLAKLGIERRRREAEPVSPAAFQQFLLSWQGIGTQREGVEALAATLEQLAGVAVPAALWERDVLPARLCGYQGQDLDSLVSGGRLVWLRLAPPSGAASTASLARMPVSFVPRSDLHRWLAAAGAAPEPGSDESRSVEAALGVRGALFFTELAAETGLLPVALETALVRLIRAGRATADHVGALRALSRPAARRRSGALEGAGRFALLHRLGREESWPPDAVMFFARILLSRYGVVFRALAAREPLMPPWRELLRAFWRLEAQGEIRGGRFVTGLAGEQFALPDALRPLRRCEQAEEGAVAVVLGADPALVANIFVPSVSLPADARVLLGNGRILSVLEKGRYRALSPEGEHRRVEFEQRLRGRLQSGEKQGSLAQGDVRTRLRAVSIAGR